MPQPPIRTPFHRSRQVILYEAGALTFAIPLLSAFTTEAATQSLALLTAISVVAILWTAAYSTAFDWLEARHRHRAADQRPIPLRLLHAAGLFPTAAFSAYALLFNLACDRLYPIQTQNRRSSAASLTASCPATPE